MSNPYRDLYDSVVPELNATIARLEQENAQLMRPESVTPDGKLTRLGMMLADKDREWEARCVTLTQSLADLSKEFHAAINEPEYAGTRQDWIYRAQAAEQELNGDGTRGPDTLKSLGLRACFELRGEHIALLTQERDDKEQALRLSMQIRKSLQNQLAVLDQAHARLRTALQSIANNSCCSSCQEAKRVAQRALENK